MTDVNAESREFWDRRSGLWEKRAAGADAFADVYGIPTIDALALDPGERVLEIGCGPGTTAVELARRVGPGGEVVAVDIAPGMIDAGVRRAEGVTNVRFLVLDAQTANLGVDFDAVFSRFGVMFFEDPVAAFTNIASALRPQGRLAVSVWGPLGDNPWLFVPTLAAAGALDAQLEFPAPDRPGPFSLADPDRVDAVLGQAGFTDIVVESLPGSRLMSDATYDDDIRTLLEIGPVSDAFVAADEEGQRAAVEAVADAVAPYREDDGWRLPGVALKVTARR